MGKDGKCEHPYLVPSPDRTLCILPGRIDVGRHYLVTGGFEGLKENHVSLTSRLLSFGRYMFNYSEYDEVAKLFNDPRFQQSARSVCPGNKQYLDPFQNNFIIQGNVCYSLFFLATSSPRLPFNDSIFLLLSCCCMRVRSSRSNRGGARRCGLLLGRVAVLGSAVAPRRHAVFR